MFKHNGSYYAYGTPADGEALLVLRSDDLVTWRHGGEIVGPPEQEGQAHWAPEVAYDNGRFFLYHSTGGREGRGHQLRVAAGNSPVGPFDEDLGALDPSEPFTIDAHPYRDDDGQWYLFYSRDFLEGERVGTGIVVDRLVDMTALAGERATVLRPHADWHLYERQRHWYDRVWDWYTVEGPFLRKHGGRYWCFYSGGAWRAENYGISSAVADGPLGPFEPVVSGDTADVLRTVPDRVLGPGHGSVAVAPDNVTEYVIYHAWDPDQVGRHMCADRLVWSEHGPTSPGPTTEPQPAPPQPLLRALFDSPDGVVSGSDRWPATGRWSVSDRELRHAGDSRPATVRLPPAAPASYLFEVNVAGRDDGDRAAAFGALISYRDDDFHTAVLIEPGAGRLTWRATRAGAVAAGGVLSELRPDFRAGAYHQLLLRRDGDLVAVTLDGVAVGTVPGAAADGAAVGLYSSGVPCAFTGVTLTDLAAG